MRVKIVTKSGREYTHEGDNIIARAEGNTFVIYSYERENEDCEDEERYEDKDMLLCITTSCIESVDYREEA
jgi:hypothetical protein